MLDHMKVKWMAWVHDFIRLFPHDLHSDMTHDDFVWGVDAAPKRMLVKFKHLMAMPEWNFQRLTQAQQDALNSVWCRDGHFATISAQGYLQVRIGDDLMCYVRRHAPKIVDSRDSAVCDAEGAAPGRAGFRG